MREIGLEVTPEWLVVGDHTMEGGMQALASLARLSPRPTAILCSNDSMRRAYEHQISIPLELSVVGFDDIWLSQFTIPPLTTVEMSQAEQTKLAFGALIADVERDSALARCQEYGLATNLVLRKTTALTFTGA